MGLAEDVLYVKLGAQICSTCFSTFVGTQHVLQMLGVGRPKPPPLPSTTASAIEAAGSARPPRSTTSTQPLAHESRDQIHLLEDPPAARRRRPRASPSARILRALCFSEMAFSFTGAVTTSLIIHDPANRDSAQVAFWGQAPHWCGQIAAFCWMGTLAMYIAKRNRATFDLAVAHAVIWLLALGFWALAFSSVYYDSSAYRYASQVVWMTVATLNIVIVCWCWGFFARRWRRQPTRRRGSYVVAKLLAYTIAFLVCVSPIVVFNITQMRNNPGVTMTLCSSLVALWPTANAIIFITRPVLCMSCFRDRDVGALGGITRRPMGAGSGAPAVDEFGMPHGNYQPHLPTVRPNHTQLVLSPRQHELKGLEIGDKIGEGIAVVYKGKWRGADVAVKMKTLMIERSEDLKEFQDACNLEIQEEAKVMKTLCHPNIVLFMEAGFYKNSICIISEYCARGSLRDVLLRANIKHLSWSTKLRLALGIAHGIQYLHNANPPMIHRDLKSPNVLVDDSWHAKIADFGTLRFAEIVTQIHNSRSRLAGSKSVNGGNADATVMTGLVGTTRWMAPEVIRGDKHYTHKVDIYSLGLIFWELIEGRLPFESTRWNHEIEKFVLQGMRPIIQSDMCPLRWKLLIVMCWQSDPSQRPGIRQVISSLQRIAREETLDTSAPRFTGLSLQSSIISTTSNASIMNALTASMLSMATASPPHAKASHRPVGGYRDSFNSVAESELEDEDAAANSEFFLLQPGNFLREPTANLADSRIDEIPSASIPMLSRELSGDSDAMISI